MAKRVCAEPGCPTLTDRARCTEHTRQRDKARGTRQQRGYDAAYDIERVTWQRHMDAGHVVTCWRCAEQGKPHPVDPARWHLGHDNHDRRIIRGPQCPESNLTDAGRA